MKRLRLTLLLLMLMMMLTACAPSGNSMEALSVTAAPQEDEIPRADGDDAAATDTSALIWYRYGDEPMLAAERRTVSRLPNEPYETALLRLLLENTSLVVTRETILQVVWGTDISVESRTVDMHIRTLRKKLGDAGRYICTVRKVGYKLTDEEAEEE